MRYYSYNEIEADLRRMEDDGVQMPVPIQQILDICYAEIKKRGLTKSSPVFKYVPGADKVDQVKKEEAFDRAMSIV